MTTLEITLVITLVIPLVIGLLVGLIVKHTINLMFAIATLILLLVLFGAVSITYQDILNQALKLLPRIIGTVSGLAERLPYSSLTFIIGFALGLGKG